jgi:hypothetical protein
MLAISRIPYKVPDLSIRSLPSSILLKLPSLLISDLAIFGLYQFSTRKVPAAVLMISKNPLRSTLMEKYI